MTRRPGLAASPGARPPPPAQKLIDLQNTRGGRVALQTIAMPEMEYDHPEKGEGGRPCGLPAG